MKVLIVDDNPAILEIISDILEVNGYIVSATDDIDVARGRIFSFKPDILIIDSTLHGKPSLFLLNEIDPDSDIKALVLTSGNETLPKDSQIVYGSLQSPFRSSEVLEEVRKLGASVDKPKDIAQPEKRTKRRWRLFSRRVKKAVVPVDDASVRHGKSYVVFEHTPEMAYSLASALALQDADVIVITDENAKAVKERFPDKNITIKGITIRPRAGHIEVSMPGTIMHEAMEFIRESSKPVVVFSNLDVIAQVNGINATLTLIHQIQGGAGKPVSIIVSSSGEGLTSKDKELLTSEMILYNQPDGR